MMVAETIDDRIRIPYPGGAIMVRLEDVAPFLLLPFCMVIGANGLYWTVFGICLLVSSLYLLGKLYSHRSRNRIYYSTTRAAFSVLLIIFLTFVLGFRKVLLWELMVLLTLFLLTMWFLRGSRSNPGYIASNIYEHSEPHEGASAPVESSLVTWIDSRPIIDGFLHRYCHQCSVRRPPRSGHCPKCEKCVRGRDHHCIWLDVCIGQYNHKYFFLFLVFLLFTGIYGVHLTTTTICTPEIYLDWFLYPSDCRFLYSDFPTGLLASAVWFTTIGLAFVLLLLLQQIVYISQNVTGLEMVKARKMGRSKFWLLATDSNVNHRGFTRNWLDFLKNRRSQNYSVQI